MSKLFSLALNDEELMKAFLQSSQLARLRKQAAHMQKGPRRQQTKTTLKLSCVFNNSRKSELD
jgi:hypothetical protein